MKILIHLCVTGPVAARVRGVLIYRLDILGDRDASSWYLTFLGTLPAARGLGYSRKLVEYVTKIVSLRPSQRLLSRYELLMNHYNRPMKPALRVTSKALICTTARYTNVSDSNLSEWST
jgi:GNAT superfamily N-acetyltransferase